MARSQGFTLFGRNGRKLGTMTVTADTAERAGRLGRQVLNRHGARPVQRNAKPRKARKARKARRPRKLKFGSPAWRKKYMRRK